MTLARGELGLRVLGDRDLADKVAEVRAELQKRHSGKYDDIPLTSIVTPEELVDPNILEALRGVGYTFFHLLEPKSLRTLMKEDPGYFDHVNSSGALRDFIPDVTIIVVNPDKVLLSDSVNHAPDVQMEIIHLHADTLRRKDQRLTQVRFGSPHVSELVQLDRAWSASHQGQKKLIVGFIRMLDFTGDSFAFAGRNFDSTPFCVLDESDTRIGNPPVSAMSVAMIPLQLVA